MIGRAPARTMLDPQLRCALEAAQVAGSCLRNAFGESPYTRVKAPAELVTDADIAAEQVALAILDESYPHHCVVAEESGTRDTGSPWTWYLDPLDGTTNFVTGNPYFAISIALAHRGEVVLGVVHNPITGETYTATRGNGAFLDGHPLRTAATASVAEAVVATDLGNGPAVTAALLRTCRAVVVNRAPALDLCTIARGRLDAIADVGTTPEDHAAGSLVLTEAGGRVRDFHGPSWSVDTIGVLAATPAVHGLLAERLDAL